MHTSVPEDSERDLVIRYYPQLIPVNWDRPW